MSIYEYSEYSGVRNNKYVLFTHIIRYFVLNFAVLHLRRLAPGDIFKDKPKCLV